jgi:hypothetical protein
MTNSFPSVAKKWQNKNPRMEEKWQIKNPKLHSVTKKTYHTYPTLPFI